MTQHSPVGSDVTPPAFVVMLFTFSDMNKVCSCETWSGVWCFMCSIRSRDSSADSQVRSWRCFVALVFAGVAARARVREANEAQQLQRDMLKFGLNLMNVCLNVAVEREWRSAHVDTWVLLAFIYVHALYQSSINADTPANEIISNITHLLQL